MKIKILQVITNLLSNAFKFTKEGGDISVVVGFITNELTQQEELSFSVTDSGIGIPAEKKLLIFDPYYQAHWSSTRTANGAGLGLTICKGIIEQHDGKIWVENKQLAKGSQFTFTLPIIFEKTNPRLLVVESGSSLSKRIEKILSTGSDYDVFFCKRWRPCITKATDGSA